MKLNKVRIRKRIPFLDAMIPSNATVLKRGGGKVGVLYFAAISQLLFMYFCDGVASGEVISVRSSASSSISSVVAVSNLGIFALIYSALPHFAYAKSIRNGKEVEDEAILFSNSTLSTSVAPALSNETLVNNTTPQSDNSSSPLFSSRTLLTTSEELNATPTTHTPSEELEFSLDESSEEMRKKRREQRKGSNRLKRQMGMAAEIALIAPALQTMGCIPKFFCGLNTKPPTRESSALNDLAYLIKFAMLDDDEVEGVDDPHNVDKRPNTRGKDGLGLAQIKEDLVLENLAEEELIKEDPGNLPFVWKDMENRIKTKTRPGSKLRIDDLMDEIIVEPEQTAVGSIFSGIKSVLRIGRSVDHVLSRVEGEANETSQASARSGRSERVAKMGSLPGGSNTVMQRRRLRLKKRPFWATPQFRQDMELAERIGKTEQDENKCSTTFNVCPYTVHEMMEIVHGGYNKKRKEMKKKNRPQWYLNADGPPESSEETPDITKKPNDPDNLVTTTTEKTQWLSSDPENQLYYAIFPHKAMEKGLTTLPTTKRPTTKVENDDTHVETVYDIGPRPMREHRRPPMIIQSHVEYENENDDEGSLEKKKPEHLDDLIHNNKMRDHPHPPKKTSWFSFGKGGNQRPPPPPQQHRPNGGRPGPQGMRRPPPQFLDIRPTGGDIGLSKEEDDNKSANDDIDSSEEEVKKQMPKHDGNASDSNEDGSSEEKKSKRKGTPSITTPAPAPEAESVQTTIIQLPPELQGDDPNIHILGIERIIENGGDLFPTGIPKQTFISKPQQLQTIIHEISKPQGPIAQPRPKYKITKERKVKKKRRLPQLKTPGIFGAQGQPQAAAPQQQPQSNAAAKVTPDKKQDKSNEDDSEENDESQENSSEEENKNEDVGQPDNNGPVPPSQGPTTINVIMHGRPSEELREPPKQHLQSRPYPEDNGNGRASGSNEDDNSDEDNGNSNSAANDASSKEISMEMAKIPNPARPPPHFRMNTSSEYTYSDENANRPMGPINYSYFQKRPRDEQNPNGGPGPSPPGQPTPQSTTQKYSTGFLSFIFGKDKKKQQTPPPQNNDNPPYPPSNNNSEEDDAADDDDDDDDNSSEEKPMFSAPEGQYEVGHLGNKPPPKFIRTNFNPPQKPDRPYRGSTSMEDSDEKRGRTTPAPTQRTSSTTTPSPKPLIYYGNPFQTFIPPPATPPQRTHYSPPPPPTEPPTTKEPKRKDSEEDDDPESDEDKQSGESREDDDNSSEEKKTPKTTTTPKVKEAPVKSIPYPPIANYANYQSSGPAVDAVVSPTTKTTKASSNKIRANYDKSEEDNQDDSGENDKENDEDSNEDKSSEERKKKKKSPPPPPTRPPIRRKPEDDELDHPAAKFPPQRPVAGDIDAVEEILGNPEEGNIDDEPENYAGDIPAPPPLALQGFAPALEIVVPTKAPLKVPPGVPLQQFYQGQNPLGGAGAPPAAGPPGPGAPLAPGPQQQNFAPVNPTSLLGLSQQAQPHQGPLNQNPGGPPARDPSEQGQQGIRNPLGQTSNRGPGQNRPGQGNRGQQGQQNQQGQRGQNNRRQQGNRNKQENEDSSEEQKSSEEKEGNSSEEASQEKDNEDEREGFDEAIESLGYVKRDEDEDDDDQPERDVNAPPPPPPVFTGSKEQKQQLENQPFLPRPITPRPPAYHRPNPGRREPILKNQLKPTELLQLHHPQKIRPPPIKISPDHPSNPPIVLPMRPSAAANLNFKPGNRPQRPISSLSHSFSVSNLLRPLVPRPNVHRKPLDPKVVQWIKQTYGIPDLNGPNRSGLENQDAKGNSKTTTTKPPRRSATKKAQKPKRTKVKLKKGSSKRKTTTEKYYKTRGSSEKRHSSEVTTSSTSTTTTTTTAAAPTTTTTTLATTKFTKPTTTATTTTSTTTSTTAKAPTTLSTTRNPNKKVVPDYITEEQEAKMAQALFSDEKLIFSSEEVKSEEVKSEEEKDSDEEEDEEETTTKKYKSKVKTKVGGQKLIITVKSVVKKNESKSSSGEKSSKPAKFGFSSAERKKLFLPVSRDKLKSGSKENYSVEKIKKRTGSNNSKSKSSEVTKRRGSASSVEVQKRKGSSSLEVSKTTLNPKFILGLRSTPRPKPIRLPPIYGKHQSIRRKSG